MMANRCGQQLSARIYITGPAHQNTRRIVMALATIVDAANTIRNTASAAHPAAQLLEAAEAMCVVNSARSLIHYLDHKLADT